MKKTKTQLEKENSNLLKRIEQLKSEKTVNLNPKTECKVVDAPVKQCEPEFAVLLNKLYNELLTQNNLLYISFEKIKIIDGLPVPEMPINDKNAKEGVVGVLDQYNDMAVRNRELIEGLNQRLINLVG